VSKPGPHWPRFFPEVFPVQFFPGKTVSDPTLVNKAATWAKSSNPIVAKKRNRAGFGEVKLHNRRRAKKE
jgi:hypothetical protein